MLPSWKQGHYFWGIPRSEFERLHFRTIMLLLNRVRSSSNRGPHGARSTQTVTFTHKKAVLVKTNWLMTMDKPAVYCTWWCTAPIKGRQGSQPGASVDSKLHQVKFKNYLDPSHSTHLVNGKVEFKADGSAVRILHVQLCVSKCVWGVQAHQWSGCFWGCYWWAAARPAVV